MIGLMKSVLQCKEKTKVKIFDSFGEKWDNARNLQPFSYKNCDCRNGVLRGGIGVQKYLDKNGNELNIILSSNAALHTFCVTLSKDGVQTNTLFYVIGLDGYLYMRQENSEIGWQRILLGKNVEHYAVRGVNKEIINFFCGSKGAFSTLDGAVFRNILNEGNIGGCVCNKRFVALVNTGEIVYGSALSSYNVDDGDLNKEGRIYTPSGYGAPVGIKAYGDSAYIFFEKGIFKLTLSATSSEHTLKEIPYQGGAICVRAQAVTSDGIIFLAREGLYYLRNNRVDRICEYLPIGPCVTSKVTEIAHFEDVVVFAYNKEKGKNSEVKRLVVYTNGEDGYFPEIYGPLGGNEYAYIQGKVYRYVKDCEEIIRKEQPFFASRELDFGTSRRKRLKSLTLKGEGSVSVVVKCGDRERTYNLTFKNGVARTKLLDRGQAFSFTFYLQPCAVVKGMEIEYATEE